MTRELRLALIKLLFANLAPIAGVIFLHWDLFEIGICYILETICVYLSFEIDHFFIDKRTRFPFILALIQLAVTLVTFTAIMYASGMIIFVILTPQFGDQNAFNQLFLDRIEEMQLVYPFLYLLILEFITYYIRKSKDLNHLSNSTWRVIRRILYSHLYIVGALLVLSVFPQNIFVFAPFFIGLKLVLEYSTEDERIFKALWKSFKTTQLGKWLTEKPAKKPMVDSYLLKIRTYNRRKNRK